MTAGLQREVRGAAAGRRALAALILAFTGIALVACGDEGDDGSDGGAAASNSVPNATPTISGVPSSQALINTLYSFTPQAGDGDGDILTFSVTGKPAWAQFSTTTGRLWGTPTASDVGSYDVTITVTDGAEDAILPPVTIRVVATALGSATLSWTPPTLNSDGTALVDLASYRIYWGLGPDTLSNAVTVSNPGLTSYVVEQLTPAKWYFAATAINSQGMESGFSAVASKTVL